MAEQRSIQLKEAGNPRDTALFLLFQICENGKKSHILLRETLDGNTELSQKDKALCEQIVSGTLMHLAAIDEWIGKFSRLPVEKMNPCIRNILRLSVYQLQHLDRVPARAVINEGTELARLHNMKGLCGFVNGILRNIDRQCIREQEKERAGEQPEEQLSPALSESGRWSVTPWLYEKLCHDFGKTEAEKVFAAWLIPRKTSVRLNLSLGLTEDEILERVREDGIRPERILSFPPVYELSGLKGKGIASLRAFQEGFLTVQDPSAAGLLRHAAPEKGDYVLDLCAAPGGKTLCFADALCGTGFVDSRDVSEQKIRRILENVERCRFRNVSVSVRDAREEDPDLFEKADIVIADVPCSGLGVAAKKPEIKRNLCESSLLELVKLQKEILSHAVQYVRPGGKLLYSTCTLTKEENEEMTAYLCENTGLRLISSERIFPDAHHDGFFIAAFEK